MKRISSFLIVVALIAGMVGCAGGESYALAIASTAGGSVTTPGEGIFTYDEGTVVNLTAEAEEGYQFVNWTGNVSTIANVNATVTTITMNGDYFITANFALAIWDWYDLDAMRNNLGGHYILMNDLDSTTAGYEELANPTVNGGKGWQPIASLDVDLVEPVDPFTGTFDGQGYEIRDLFVDRPDESCVGLFSFVDEVGRIEDIGVVNVTVTGSTWVGGPVGFNRGTVSNSYSTGSVTGYACVGGLVGDNCGTVSDSYATGSVTGSDSVGGLVGWNDLEGTVSKSYSIGNVTGLDDVGGLVGWNYGTVSNSYYNYDEVLINGESIITIGALFGEDFDQWLANDKFLDVNERLSQENGYYVVNNVGDFKELLVFGQGNSLKFRLENNLDLATEPNFYIPYLAGEFDGNGHKVSNLSFNFDFVSYVGSFGYLAFGGEVTQVSVENVNITGYYFVGGLVGYNNNGTVSDSYTTGSVTGHALVGGLLGENWGTVSNSYSTGDMTGGNFTGGLVGFNRGTVSNSYSTGNVSGDWYVGGLVGYNNNGTVSDSYATGSVTGNRNVGGLVGCNGGEGTVSNSYSTGNVTGLDDVGGLVGLNFAAVSNSYSTGRVTGGAWVGGLVGQNAFGTVSNSFWDTQTSGQATSHGGTGRTTEQMQDITTFSGASWDIVAVGGPGERNPTYIWNIVDDVTYPFLSWQPVI